MIWDVKVWTSGECCRGHSSCYNRRKWWVYSPMERNEVIMQSRRTTRRILLNLRCGLDGLGRGCTNSNCLTTYLGLIRPAERWRTWPHRPRHGKMEGIEVVQQTSQQFNGGNASGSGSINGSMNHNNCEKGKPANALQKYLGLFQNLYRFLCIWNTNLPYILWNTKNVEMMRQYNIKTVRRFAVIYS